jgi:hypothetical protein
MVAPPPLPTRRAAWPGVAVRVGLIVFFAWLVGRHWHPYYGFTDLIQMDRESLATSLPELRTAPIYTYPGGYDGHYYAQLAARPMADDPALAIDNIVYRGRRILLSWVAWAMAGGDSVAAVRTYAWLNLVVWGALAALAWRILPPSDWRSTVAWAGLLFSAGALHSVRLGLTDLLALLFVAAAGWLIERGRRGTAAALLGLGGLARETSLLAAAALWPRRGAPRADWIRVAGWAACAAVPLAAWLWHLRRTHGLVEPGLSNLNLPVSGWVGRWIELGRGFSGTDRWTFFTALLVHVGLSVQLAYIILRHRWDDAWWRIGAAWGLLMLLIGSAVWEGYPGAAARVLLPLGLAFNILAVRQRASLGWLVAGNLSVVAGVFALWSVPHDLNELSAGHCAHGSYIVHTDKQWYGVETGRGRAWAWCARQGALEIDCWPRRDAVAPLRMQLKGFTPRPVEILQERRVIWKGEATTQVREIVLPAVNFVNGRARLEIRSATAPGRESDAGRELGFAVYGLAVD